MPKMHPLTIPLAQGIAAGEDLTALANRVNRAESTVRELLKRLQLYPQHKPSMRRAQSYLGKVTDEDTGALNPEGSQSRQTAPSSRVDPAVIETLGTKTDRQIAEEHGYSVAHIQTLRIQRGIPSFRSQRLTKIREQLGTKPDTDIAAEHGLSLQSVRSLRRKHGIADHRTTIREELLTVLGQETDEAIARRYGYSTSGIRSMRINLGIPPHKTSRAHFLHK